LGIMDRVKLNVRANLNYMLDKAEDPQKVFDQFLLDMQDSVREVKLAVADAIAGMKKLEQEIDANDTKASQWEERAILALKNNNEELAKKALEKKIACLEKDRMYKNDLTRQKQTVDELKAGLSDLELKLDELYKKRIELIKQFSILRTRAAQTSPARPVPSQISIDTNAFDIYDHIVENVKDMEDQAEAFKAFLELSGTDEVEEKFKKMERDAELEAELKALKEKILP